MGVERCIGRAAVSPSVLLAMPSCITFQTNVHTLIVMRAHTHRRRTPLLDLAIGQYLSPCIVHSHDQMLPMPTKKEVKAGAHTRNQGAKGGTLHHSLPFAVNSWKYIELVASNNSCLLMGFSWQSADNVLRAFRQPPHSQHVSYFLPMFLVGRNLSFCCSYRVCVHTGRPSRPVEKHRGVRRSVCLPCSHPHKAKQGLKGWNETATQEFMNRYRSYHV